MDENIKTLNKHVEDSDKQNIDSFAKKRKLKKFKTSIYLTEEAEQALTELYIHRLRKDRKIDRSVIACDAILDLYEKECLRAPSN